MSARTMKRWLGVAVTALVGLSVIGTAGGANAGEVIGNPACGGSQAVLEPGRTLFTAHGSTPFTNAQSGGNGRGTLTWSLRGQITGDNTNSSDGNISGFLNATIDWNASGQPDTTYTSSCVAGVIGQVGSVEVRTLGSVSSFPNPSTAGGSNAAASMHLERVRPKVADLAFDMVTDGSPCTGWEQILDITRPAAPAPGHKTGNGSRVVADLCD